MKIYGSVNRPKISYYEAPYFLHDSENNKYLDLHSGAGAFFWPQQNIQSQIFSPTNFFVDDRVNNFIYKLEETTGYKCPILLCSGSEANEAAIKLAMKFNHKRKVAFLSGCYFGRTYLATMCSDSSKYKIYLPESDDFVRVNGMNDFKLSHDISCFISETYPSVSLDWDMNVPELVEQAQADGIVTIVDETKGGFRTGSFFSFDKRCSPDIITMSKSLCSGFPVSAVLVKPFLYELCDDDWYTTTSGGHPIGCEIGLNNLLVGPDTSLAFQELFEPFLYDIFGDRLKIKGRYIGISNMHGHGFAKWCKEHGFLVYGRSDFVSLFPNYDMLFEFSRFMNFLRDEIAIMPTFFKD